MISSPSLPATRSSGYPHAARIDGYQAESCKGDWPIDADISDLPLNSLELTGRAATHVRDVADPRCVLHIRAAEALIALRRRPAGLE